MSAMEELTPRQREVLALLAKGHTNGEIGEMLGISADGVKWHVGEILARLGVHSREEAAEWWRSECRTGARVRRWIGGMPFGPVATGVGIAGVAVVAAVVAIVALRSGGGPSERATAAVESGTPTAEPTSAPSPAATTPGFLPDGPVRFRVCSEIDGYRKLTAMEMTDVFHNRRFGDGVRPEPLYWSLFLADFYWMAEPHAISANVENVAFGKGTWTGTTPPPPDACARGDRQDEAFQALSLYQHRVVAMEIRNGTLLVTVAAAPNSFERVEYPEPSLPRGPLGKGQEAVPTGLRIVDTDGQLLMASGLAGDSGFRDDGSFVSGLIGVRGPSPQTLELTRPADIELFCSRPANAVTFRSATGDTKVVQHGVCGDVWTAVGVVHLEPGVWTVSVDGEGFYTLLAEGGPRPCRC